jgi:hypothetical protein
MVDAYQKFSDAMETTIAVIKPMKLVVTPI